MLVAGLRSCWEWFDGTRNVGVLGASEVVRVATLTGLEMDETVVEEMVQPYCTQDGLLYPNKFVACLTQGSSEVAKRISQELAGLNTAQTTLQQHLEGAQELYDNYVTEQRAVQQEVSQSRPPSPSRPGSRGARSRRGTKEVNKTEEEVAAEMEACQSKVSQQLELVTSLQVRLQENREQYRKRARELSVQQLQFKLGERVRELHEAFSVFDPDECHRINSNQVRCPPENVSGCAQYS